MYRKRRDKDGWKIIGPKDEFVCWVYWDAEVVNKLLKHLNR